VPTLDEAAALPRLLGRLREAVGERDRADRVVVADGGSRDGTAERARELGAEVVAAPRGRGPQLAAGARALGRTASSARDLLLFLHADTVPDEGALAAVRRAFGDPDVVATGMVQRIEGRRRIYRLIERAADFRVRRLGLVYGDSGLAVRGSAYDAVGGFRDLALFEDVDLSRRLRRAGRVRLVHDARLWVSARRWEEEGALRRTLRNWILTAGYAAGVHPDRLARHSPPRATSDRP